jgi:hypothetical protein
MFHPSVTGAPWRVLILDRDPADPKWLLAMIMLPADAQRRPWPAARRHGGQAARRGEPAGGVKPRLGGRAVDSPCRARCLPVPIR